MIYFYSFELFYCYAFTMHKIRANREHTMAQVPLGGLKPKCVMHNVVCNEHCYKNILNHIKT